MGRRLALALALALLLVAPAARAAFPGANGAIAFTRNPVATDTTQVDVLPPGSSPFAPGAGLGDDPAWSPNGTRILFTRSTMTGQDLWVMNADGSGATQITHMDGTAFDPTWSPDGSKVAFAHGNDSSDGILIANADGSGTPTKLPGSTANDDSPAWSLDGNRIAFRLFDSSLNQNQIWVSDVSGANRGPLDIPPDGLEDGDPAWSPDGATVYFDRGMPHLLGCLTHSQIWVVPSTGGLAHDISPDPSLSDYEPAPSPDGSLVAFSRCDDQADQLHHLYVMRAVGGVASPLTSGNQADDGEADWQPTAPRFATGPSISGNGVNNQTLTATAGSSPGGGSTSLQFLRCDSHGANCVPIPGASAARARAAASSATYRLTSADLGHTILVRQTQTNSLGSSFADSTPTGSVVPSKGHCSNRFAGTARANRIEGSAGSDRISGGRGKDRLSGLGGADCISGGAGNDVLSGGKGNDTLSGSAGNDRITAGPGRNKVSGGAGNDRINVRNHRRDVVNCGKGKKDRVIADKRDKLRGCEIVKRRK